MTKKLSKLAKNKLNPNSSYYKRLCDKVWSERIRQFFDNKCCICSAIGKLDCHHIIDRVHKATRHLINNGLLLCVKHHKWGLESVHQNPLFVLRWLSFYRKEQYEWIIANYNREELRTYQQIYIDLGGENEI